MAESDRTKWNERYRQPANASRGPSPFLISLDDQLPRRGRALDVAGGTGRHAIWLARRGLDVTLADVSDVAVDLASDAAEASGVHIRRMVSDLEIDALPPGPWDVIVTIDFLLRPLFDVFPAVLGPAGLLIISHPTRSNLQRHAKPGPAYLLDDGELPALVAPLEILHAVEGWMESGRHEARLLARRRPA